MMPDREKVIKGLECHRIDNYYRINCADCPYDVNEYNHIRCVNDLHNDALALLKEQPEIVRCKDCKYRHSLTGTCVNIDGACFQSYVGDDWFCAAGERKE